MAVAASYPWLCQVVGILLLLVISTMARPATFDNDSIIIRGLQRRAQYRGTGLMCKLHSMNCPDMGKRKRSDTELDIKADSDRTLDDLFWEMWKLQMLNAARQEQEAYLSGAL